eukprot:4565617-Karenia_brevis.AAC.1
MHVCKMKQYHRELDEALRTHDHATAWKLTRIVARACRSSRRQHIHSPTPQPTAKNIISKLSKEPSQGGWGAQVIDEDTVLNLESNFEHIRVMKDNPQAKLMFESFAYNMKNSKNRKAGPPHEVPSEAWRILLDPQWVSPGYKVKWG